MGQLDELFVRIFPMIANKEYPEFEYLTTLGPDRHFSDVFSHPFCYYRGGTSWSINHLLFDKEEV